MGKRDSSQSCIPFRKPGSSVVSSRAQPPAVSCSARAGLKDRPSRRLPHPQEKLGLLKSKLAEVKYLFSISC